VAFAAGGDAQVAERAATRIVAKLLAGPMAALRKAVQRGEPLDAQAMMLLEMFAPAQSAPAPRRAKSASSTIPAPALRPQAASTPADASQAARPRTETRGDSRTPSRGTANSWASLSPDVSS
jgi:hypothetical protein